MPSSPSGSASAAPPSSSLLIEAAATGSAQDVAALLERGANPNGPTTISSHNNCGMGCTPLMSAAEGGHADVVTTLLAARADCHALDTRERTALHLAAAAHHADVVALLLAKGADPWCRCRPEGGGGGAGSGGSGRGRSCWSSCCCARWGRACAAWACGPTPLALLRESDAATAASSVGGASASAGGGGGGEAGTSTGRDGGSSNGAGDAAAVARALRSAMAHPKHLFCCCCYSADPFGLARATRAGAFAISERHERRRRSAGRRNGGAGDDGRGCATPPAPDATRTRASAHVRAKCKRARLH